MNLIGGVGSVDLDVDFSQFQVLGQLQPGDRNRVDLESSVGLARTTELGHVWFVVPQQAGRIPVEVEILGQRPELDSGWDEVIEIPFFSTHDTVIQGYDGSMGTHPLDLIPRQGHRIRYSIANVVALDEVSEQPALRHRLQFWPAEEAAPAVLVSKTTWGRVSQYNLVLERAARRASLLPAAERLDAYVEEAVSAFSGDRQSALERETLATRAYRYVWALRIGELEEAVIRHKIASKFRR